MISTQNQAAAARAELSAQSRMTGYLNRQIPGEGSMVAGVYGKCPLCSAPVTIRERRLNGDDRCAAGHVFPSSRTVR